MLLLGSTAQADCYELIGCSDSEYMDLADLTQLSCENLWHVRNRIFDENGYCFQTAQAQDAFDNSDCSVTKQAAVKLNDYERANVKAILGAESQLGCR
jgi:hypothetical protein